MVKKIGIDRHIKPKDCSGIADNCEKVDLNMLFFHFFFVHAAGSKDTVKNQNSSYKRYNFCSQLFIVKEKFIPILVSTESQG